jgi:hypothetical protein
MYFLLLLVLAAATVANGSGRCTAADHDIIERIGDTFEARFEDFGGLFVSKSSYESKVQRAVGISALCSTCFGDAYICGWDHCKMDCLASALSAKCRQCLKAHQCVQNCETCLE